MRTAECLTCNATFTVRPNHPMIEAAHCDACLAILRPLWLDVGLTPLDTSREAHR